MDIQKTALGLIELSYEAALAPQKWQQVMSAFIEAIGTNTAILRETNYDAHQVGLFKTVGFDPFYIDAYRKHFIRLDYFAEGLLSQTPGQVSCGDQYVSWAQQRKSEFYNDYLRPQKNRYCLGVTLAHDNNHHLLFALQRTKQQGEFSAQNLQLIRLVAPHMARAISIHRKMQTLTLQQQWALSALDHLHTGVILLSDHARPVFINKAAESLMSDNCGLSICRDELTLTNHMDCARLQRFIADAALSASGFNSGIPAGASLRTLNQHGVALDIQIIPLVRDKSEQPWGFSLPNGCVAVFLSTTKHTHLCAETIAARYGFTPAESKLAVLLGDGKSLEQASHILTISIQTARSHLKALFAKTQVSRQAELVARLLTDILSHPLSD